MNIYLQNVLEKIRSSYNQMTDTEKIAADFFLQNHEKQDFSAKVLSKYLHISETTLSRFAKKAGFSGYREFLYMYEINFHSPSHTNSDYIQKILHDYQKLIEGFYNIIDEAQIERLSLALSDANRISLYALGSSACSAMEFKLRFMRLNLPIEVIDNPHLMQMQAVLANPNDLVIGISLSGETEQILTSLKTAKVKNATVFFITSSRKKYFANAFDEIVNVPSIAGLSQGDNISPQLPILIITDIIYNRFMNKDTHYKQALFQDTLSAISKEILVNLTHCNTDNRT